MAKERPNIFKYHDYREFLKDWLAYKKASQSGFSLRYLAGKSGLGAGYLSMVNNRTRNLSSKALTKLIPPLGLEPRERPFFELLVKLGDADSQEERLSALDRMKKFSTYRKNNSSESEVFQYLTHWYYVAIREMTALPEFKTNPSWIASQLNCKVSIPEIEKALKFLIENKYIEVLSNGKAHPPEKSLDYMGGIYKIALTQMHQEMLSLAGKSIESTPSAERAILGHTFAVEDGDFDQAREILNEAFEKVRKLSKGKSSGKSVYHMELALFPLTRVKGVKNEI
ncbi:MAG: TIGR02147 family protein [Bdellovibrionota bacterium]